jgi:hypothetical protein
VTCQIRLKTEPDETTWRSPAVSVFYLSRHGDDTTTTVDGPRGNIFLLFILVDVLLRTLRLSLYNNNDDDDDTVAQSSSLSTDVALS